MTGSCFVTGSSRARPLSSCHCLTPTQRQYSKAFKYNRPITGAAVKKITLSRHAQNIVYLLIILNCDNTNKKKNLLLYHYFASTNLERSWRCKKGRQRTPRLLQRRPETRLSRRGSSGPTCWRKPRGSASILPCCESACTPGRASRSLKAPPAPGGSEWWSTGPARHGDCFSSSTWKQKKKNNPQNRNENYPSEYKKKKKAYIRWESEVSSQFSTSLIP